MTLNKLRTLDIILYNQINVKYHFVFKIKVACAL